MCHRSEIFIVGLLAFFIAGSADASIVDFEGTLSLKFEGCPWSGGARDPIPLLVQTGAGVATINGSAGGSHLTRITFDGGIGPGSDAVGVTDPLVTAGNLISVRMYATLGSGSLDDISMGSSLSGTLTVMGHVALCLAFNCAIPFNVYFQEALDGEAIGVGIGGLITRGGYEGIRVSLEAAPWTIETRTLWSWGTMTDGMGGQTTMTVMEAGFRHGPSSNTSTTALKSGVVSFITPMVYVTEGIAGNSQHVALFSRLTIHFVPEPGMVLLLGSGIAGLVVLGRTRMRR